MSRKWLLGAVALILVHAVPHLADAVTLNPRGVGQALIYPYYTVNRDQNTLVSITNAGATAKAVQVRLREGYNGRDALSLRLFLGAHDTWTFALSQNAIAGARLTTSDTSCTDPPIPADGVDLRSAAYDGTGSVPADGGPTDISRTREGSIELIVGGNIRADSPTDRAVRHSTGGGAPSCGTALANFVSDLEAPTDAVYGSASIVSVTEGTFYAYNADALQSLTRDVMFLPGNPYPGPDLDGALSNEGVHGVARAYVTTNDGHQLGVDYATGIDAVSAAFMADGIYNDYIVSASLGAQTDWVVTFPTKHFYVDSQYGNVPRAPFEHAFVAPGIANTKVSGASYDRDQQSVSFGGNCDTCEDVELSYEVNVIGLGGLDSNFTTRVLGSNLATTYIPTVGEAGYAELDLTTSDNNAHTFGGGVDAEHGGPITLRGLPASGFMVYNIVNANAQPDTLANYSGGFAHRKTLFCEGDELGCPQIGHVPPPHW